jgi:adenosylhomocysteine nucleosidase
VRRLLVLTAIDVEARGLARHLGLAPVAGSTWPHFRGGAVEIACVGPGAARLAARGGALEPAAMVLSAGTCGGLAPGLRVGELVVPETVVARGGPPRETAALPLAARGGRLLCVDGVVESAAAKARLWLETGALAVDLESDAILDWAAARATPAAVVRAVSDAAGRGVPADLAAVVSEGGRTQPLRAVRAALRRPGAVADALALHRGTAAALRTVAAALARLAEAGAHAGAARAARQGTEA